MAAVFPGAPIGKMSFIRKLIGEDSGNFGEMFTEGE
jgi:hypothetical protein